MKTGTMSLVLLGSTMHSWKRAFPSVWLFPIAPIHEWAVFIEREKVLLWRKKKAKGRKTIQVPFLRAHRTRRKHRNRFFLKGEKWISLGRTARWQFGLKNWKHQMKASFPLLLSFLQSPFGFHPNEIENGLRQQNSKIYLLSQSIMDKILLAGLYPSDRNQGGMISCVSNKE